jgi:hypothetical protein
MKPRNKSALLMAQAWETISKKVYWDRDVPLALWRERVSEAHHSYLPEAVRRMPVREFIYFYGKDRFVLDWPRLRAALPPDIASRCGMYDIFWSQLAGGGLNLRPVPQFYELATRQREFLVEAMRVPGSSIYQIAKRLGMQYRRAHDHAQALIAQGIVRDKAIDSGLRRQRLLYPTYI